MPEVIGAVASCLTIAGIFKVCVEAFDLIQSIKCQQREIEILALSLSLEKARLYTWGQSMGLVDSDGATKDATLEHFPFNQLFQAALKMLSSLLIDATNLQLQYGCERAEACDLRMFETARQLAAVFDNFTITKFDAVSIFTLKKRAKWFIRDGKKFKELLSQITALVSNLQHLTHQLVPVRAHDTTMISRVEMIRDIETLDLISEACQADYPDLAEAASMLSDRQTNFVLEEQQQTPNAAGPQTLVHATLESCESMTVTELKHELVETSRQRQQYEQRLTNVLDYLSCIKHVSDGVWKHQRHIVEQLIGRHTTYLVKGRYPDLRLFPAQVQPILELCCAGHNHYCQRLDLFSGGVHSYDSKPTSIDRILEENGLLSRCVKICYLSRPKAHQFPCWSIESFAAFAKQARKLDRERCQLRWNQAIIPFACGEESRAFLAEAFDKLKLGTKDEAYAMSQYLPDKSDVELKGIYPNLDEHHFVLVMTSDRRPTVDRRSRVVLNVELTHHELFPKVFCGVGQSLVVDAAIRISDTGLAHKTLLKTIVSVRD